MSEQWCRTLGVPVDLSMAALNNWRRHGESQRRSASNWRVDPFSSAPSFDGFKDVDARAQAWPATYQPLPVWRSKTWLLSTGWRKHGLIGATEVPGPPWKQPRRKLAKAHPGARS